MRVYRWVMTHAFEFYYWYCGVLNRLLPQVVLDGTPLTVYPNVYKPLENEHRLGDYCEPGTRVLDVGCGSGVATVFAARHAREVVAVDISPSAVANTERNCRDLGLDNVQVLQSDMFQAVEGRFDVIIAHPPYFDLDIAGEERQYGTSVCFVDELFANAARSLTKGGKLVVLFPTSHRERLERLARENALRLVSCERRPPKTWRTRGLSLLYFVVGFRTCHYVFEHAVAPAALVRPRDEGSIRAAVGA